MSYAHCQIGISVDDHKLAALFFDYILPTNSMIEIPRNVIFHGANLPKQLNQFMMSYTQFFARRVQELTSEGIPTDKIEDRALEDSANYNIAMLHRYLASKGFWSVPLFISPEGYQRFLTPGKSPSVEFKIIGAPLIDTSNLSWDQIIDIRSDTEFTTKLRRFRVFLNENYENKPQEFVIDDLLKKLDEYEKACKNHSLDLIISSLSKVLDSKSLLAALGITTAGILIGNPELTNLGIISGSAIEIGKLSLHIAEKKLSFENTLNASEISYLFDLKEKATK